MVARRAARKARTRPESCVERLRAQLAVARRGLDPEGVHQARVAARRLRAWLTLRGREESSEELDEALRWLIGGLGRVRDLDVLLQSPLGQDPRVAPLLSRRRAVARRAEVKLLDSRRLKGVLARLAKLPRLRLRHRKRALRRAFKKAERALEAWREASAPGRRARPRAELRAVHRVRRALRRLRYLLEWLGVDVRALVPVQSALGAIQDLSLLQGLLSGTDLAIAADQAVAEALAAISSCCPPDGGRRATRTRPLSRSGEAVRAGRRSA
jgi:CHAD domain-containing protein